MKIIIFLLKPKNLFASRRRMELDEIWENLKRIYRNVWSLQNSSNILMIIWQNLAVPCEWSVSGV